MNISGIKIFFNNPKLPNKKPVEKKETTPPQLSDNGKIDLTGGFTPGPDHLSDFTNAYYKRAGQYDARNC